MRRKFFNSKFDERPVSVWKKATLNDKRTSMKIPVEVWVQRYMSGEQVRVTHAVFTYVAVDSAGKPIPVRQSV